jgi:hypothetical protein
MPFALRVAFVAATIIIRNQAAECEPLHTGRSAARVIMGASLPMEALMDRRSYPFKPSPEDLIVINKWKVRLAAVYGAVMLMLVLVLFASRGSERTEIAKRDAGANFSAAAVAGERPAH